MLYDYSYLTDLLWVVDLLLLIVIYSLPYIFLLFLSLLSLDELTPPLLNYDVIDLTLLDRVERGSFSSIVSMFDLTIEIFNFFY